MLFQLRSFFLSSVCVLAASASSWSFRNCEKIFLFSNHFLRQTMIKWWLWWWCWCTNGTQMEPNQQLTQNHTSRKKIKLTVEDKSLLVQLTVVGPKKFYNTGYSLPRSHNVTWPATSNQSSLYFRVVLIWNFLMKLPPGVTVINKF